MTISEFASSRGFTVEELTRFEIRVEGDVVVIPTLGRQGAWYEREHRPNSAPKYSSPPASHAHLYNPRGLGPHSDEVWIAEGEFDTICLLTVGAPAVGVLGAGAFNRAWALLFAQAEIVIAFDADRAGDEAADKLTQLWQPGQVSRFRPKDPYKDLNEWFVADRAAFEAAVLDW